MPIVMKGDVWISRRLQDGKLFAEYIEEMTPTDIKATGRVQGDSVPEVLRLLADHMEKDS